MRVVLVGAVQSTMVALETLLAAGVKPAGIVTLPPEALARHSDAVDLEAPARHASIPVIHSTDINASETLQALEEVGPDLVLVIGWSQICRKAFRDTGRLGCIGFHPSALPEFKGRAVIPWTILMRQPTSGSTFFWLDDGIDTGDILVQRVFPLDEEETARSLYDKHMQSIQELLPDVIAQFAKGSPNRTEQRSDNASYCARRGPEDGAIDWRDGAQDVLVLIRAAGDPYPGAFTRDRGEQMFIDRARFYPDGAKFIGMTGQVQTHTTDGFVVRCGDGACIEVLAWRSPSGKKPVRHSVLGRN
jgi:methionyl-tRNA formyltransferase